MSETKVPPFDVFEGGKTHDFKPRDPDEQFDDGQWAPDDEPASKHPPLWAEPFRLPDEASIPRREWLYPGFLLRKFLSVTVAPGGAGKSALALVEGVAMASGNDLLGRGYDGVQRRVGIFNGEDPQDELARRVFAIAKHNRMAGDAIGDRLFLESGRRVPLKFVVTEKAGPRLAVEAVDRFQEAIELGRLDVAIVDPLVTLTSAAETNEVMELLSAELARIADETGAAIHVVHHTRKPSPGSGGEITADDARGGSALANKARIVRVLNRMSKDEGERAGLDGHNHRRFFRLGSDKVNLTPPDADTSWHEIKSVRLANGPENDPTHGDSMGVVTPWKWPDAFSDMPADCLGRAMAVARRGQDDGSPWKEDSQALEWIGYALAKEFRLDAYREGRKVVGKDVARLKSMIRQWIGSGAFAIEKRKDVKGNERPVIVEGILNAGE
ncbi:MAG: AAA family ATPase [Pseudomonadota bacterium]